MAEPLQYLPGYIFYDPAYNIFHLSIVKFQSKPNCFQLKETIKYLLPYFILSEELY